VALAHGAVRPGPKLFRLPGLPAVQQELYAAAEFAEIGTLPWDDASPERPFPTPDCERQIDLRDFAFDPAFRGCAMIDYFLARLGLDPGTVNAADKRNAWLAPRLRALPAPAGHILLCPKASMKLRDMPDRFARRLAERLTRRTGRNVVRQSQVASLAELAAQVAGAALVVSTDTAMVHLADALARPCLAFFTTHRPEWRVRDYPLCRAVHLPAQGLPAALEFPRDAADLAAAHAAWFPHGDDFGWLDAALDEALNRLEER
jgi:hypothetical protein